ncbi:IPTL-CTERM sorting domain-containing protein [Delftia tsuruhatensis]|uniref:IPTL-CTERM sorting domain-containing protein n=1 Tax=Delftia tsuruhatensis TaxID=180282 RepID=UPI001F345CB0|nr:IPTL-CTERM sorting domain-containing protein [Delftia tsuruhatensis]
MAYNRPVLSLGAVASSMLLAWSPVYARQLAPIDALGEAPVVMRAQSERAQALPERVQKLSREERLGLPTFVQLRADGVGRRGEVRAQASALNAEGAARRELKALAGLYGLTSREVDAAPLGHVQALATGAHLVRLGNQRDGVEVFREQATVLLDGHAQATAIGGYLGSTALAPASGTARLGAAEAVARALQDYGFAPEVARLLQEAGAVVPAEAGPYRWLALPEGVQGSEGAVLQEPARVKPVWFRLPQGLVAAFYVELLVREQDQEHGYAYVVAADDGRLLLRSNQSAHAHGYRVWADPVTGVPHPGPQGRNGVPHPTGQADGYAPPLVAPDLVSGGRAADPWLPPGATLTDGNNVRAFANLVAPDGMGPMDAEECTGPLVSDFRACATAPGVFDHRYDLARGPLADRTQAAASVVQLFYVTNWLHDWFYGAGFDEASGNAQHENFGRGGLGGDALLAQALDFDGTNNANMLTRADGASSRMRMYRFNNRGVSAAVLSPSALAGPVPVAGADFGPGQFNVASDLVSAQPPVACSALFNAAEVAGRIVLVDGGSCSFDIKVLAAQNAGAAGVAVINTVADAPIRMGSGNPAGVITIPSVHVPQSAGNAWKSRLAAGEAVPLRLVGLSTERSSALDSSIVAHEWGHFISNRLIGNASGLVSSHAQGLGEGWGDFHSLLMTATDQDRNHPGNDRFQGAYSIAAYSMGFVEGPGGADIGNTALYGLRRYPYSTDLVRNPLTFKHIQSGTPLPASPAPAFFTDNAEIHNMGEVWASMLWECYVALLNAHPFQDAQDRMKRYLVTGYKLTPVNPLLTEARDALLAAAQAEDPADYQRFLRAFAKRGAGIWARSMADRYSATNVGVIESFSAGGALELDSMDLDMSGAGSQRCDADTILDSGETGVLRLALRNRGAQQVPVASLQLSTSVAGLSFPDGSTVDVPAMEAGQTRVMAVRIRLDGLSSPANARVTAMLSHAEQEAGPVQGQLDLPLHIDAIPDRLTMDDGQAVPSAMQPGSSLPDYADNWGVRADGASNRLYGGGSPHAPGSHWLRTPPLQVAASGDFGVSFRHRYRFEQSGSDYYDGGQLMLSTDDGLTWKRIMAPGYSDTLHVGSGNPAQGQPAYVGQSRFWPAMEAEALNLGTAYAGQRVRLAWVIHTDMSGGAQGWEVDDIAITGITNTPFPQTFADAQTCAAPGVLSVASGTPQSAPVGSAFTQRLRVRLQDAAGTALAGRAVTFTAPGTGASARFAGGLAQVLVGTDTNGYAETVLAANGTEGGYVVNAAAAGASASFALRNTAAPVGAGGLAGGAGPLAVSGATPGGSGSVAVSVQSAAQALPAHAYFSQAAFSDASAAGVPALQGRSFPFGLTSFVLENVGTGNTVRVRIDYPSAVPAGAEYWKYGRSTPAGAAHWHQIPVTPVGPNSVTIDLTDGGQGDTDGSNDGRITDPGGLAILNAPAVPASAAPIPVLSPWATGLLALGLAWLGGRRRRR